MSSNVDPTSTSLEPAENKALDPHPPRWREFARHYAACGVATKAARLAGYGADHAHQQGYRLLQRPEILAMVEEERVERQARLNVSPERIIEALAAIAFGDPRDVAGWDAEGNGTVTPSDQLTDDQAMLIAGLEQVQRFDSEGNPTSSTLKFKFASRQAAIDALARINGMYRDKVEVETIDGVASEMADLRARRRARQSASDAATIVDAVVVDNGGTQGEDFQGAAGRPSEQTEPASAPAGVNALLSRAAQAAGPSGEGSDPGPIQPGIAARFIASLPKEDGDGMAGS